MLPEDDAPSPENHAPHGYWVIHDPERVLDDSERDEILAQLWRDHPHGMFGADDPASATETWPLDAYDPDKSVSWWAEWMHDVDE